MTSPSPSPDKLKKVFDECILPVFVNEINIIIYFRQNDMNTSSLVSTGSFDSLKDGNS